MMRAPVVRRLAWCVPAAFAAGALLALACSTGTTASAPPVAIAEAGGSVADGGTPAPLLGCAIQDEPDASEADDAAAGRAGEIDLTWGDGGMVTNLVPNTTDAGVAAVSLGLLGDGRVVLGGSGPSSPQQPGPAFVAVLTPRGELDRTFASTGLLMPLPTVDAISARVRVVGGRIVFLGVTASDSLELGRLVPGCGLDPTFGDGGTVRLPGAYTGAPDFLAEPGGLTIATADWGAPTASGLFALGPGGAPVTSFGTSGVVVPLSPNPEDVVSGVILGRQSTGKLVVLANRYIRATGSAEAFVFRYSAGGVHDPSFGSGGVALLGDGAGNAVTANGLAVQSDDGIVVAGHDIEDDTAHVWRLLPDGASDATFGGAGRVDLGRGGASAATVQRDGKLLVAGYRIDPEGAPQTALWRLRPEGILDATFGAGGLVVGPGSSGELLALEPDGRILVAGQAPRSYQFGVWRFWP